MVSYLGKNFPLESSSTSGNALRISVRVKVRVSTTSLDDPGFGSDSLSPFLGSMLDESSLTTFSFSGSSWEVEGADFLSEATLFFAECSCDAGGVDFL